MNLTIKEVNELYNQDRLTPEVIELLKLDERQGVKVILKKYQRKVEALERLENQFKELSNFENIYKHKGYNLLAGIDEAGRGPLAGPVVAAAVILPENFKLLGLTDSKQISMTNRKLYFDYIIEHAISYHVEVIDAEIIDRVNIYEATKLAMIGSYRNLKVKPDYLLVDAVKLQVNDIPYDAIIKGDAKSISIAAASILAKVTRDRIMEKYHGEYPEYNFKKHMGYGTKEHLEAIEKFGIRAIHRKSFSPIKEYI